MPVDPIGYTTARGADTIGLIASKIDPAEERQQCDSKARATTGKDHDVTAVQCGEARIAQSSKKRHRSKEQKYNTHDSIALSIAHANLF